MTGLWEGQCWDKERADLWGWWERKEGRGTTKKMGLKGGLAGKGGHFAEL